MSDTNKIAQRQMQQQQLRDQVLSKYQTDYVNNKYNMQNSQLVQKFKLPPKIASQQPGQIRTNKMAHSRVSKKRSFEKTFSETQQQNSMQLENNQNQSQQRNFQMMSIGGDSPRTAAAKARNMNQSHYSTQQSSSSHQNQILRQSSNDALPFHGSSSSQSDSQQIMSDSPKQSSVENGQNQQINQQQVQALKFNLQIAKDRFFTSLENNLTQYVNDRSAAYNFITKELNIYDDETLVTMNQILQGSSRDSQQPSSEVLQREKNILTKGINLYNQKYKKLEQHTDSLKQSLMQMQTKLQEKELENQKLRHEREEQSDPQHQQNFQMMRAAYEHQARELEKLRAQNHYLLNLSIQQPHVNNHHPFGGHNGSNFDGSVC